MGIRLQGTDGIRGPIKQHLPSTENLMKWYLQTGEVTPEFFFNFTHIRPAVYSGTLDCRRSATVL